MDLSSSGSVIVIAPLRLMISDAFSHWLDVQTLVSHDSIGVRLTS